MIIRGIPSIKIYDYVNPIILSIITYDKNVKDDMGSVRQIY